MAISSGSDAYATGRILSTFDPEAARAARKTYWNLRQTGSSSIRNWLDTSYAGAKDGDGFLHLYQMGVNADCELEAAYLRGGIEEVNRQLDHSDTLETTINTIGTQHAVALTGDLRMGETLMKVKPPGMTQILPQDTIEDARSEAQSLYKQEQRSTGGGQVGQVRARRAGWFAQPKGGQQQQMAGQGRGGNRGRGGRGGGPPPVKG